jgi:predicted ATPase
MSRAGLGIQRAILEYANELVNHLLTIPDLPDAMRQLILERAKGNPFYLEEVRIETH